MISWKQRLESVSESLNDPIRLRNEYLLAENRLLRNQIDGRVQLTDSERQELAESGAQLGKKAEVTRIIEEPGARHSISCLSLVEMMSACAVIGLRKGLNEEALNGDEDY